MAKEKKRNKKVKRKIDFYMVINRRRQTVYIKPKMEKNNNNNKEKYMWQLHHYLCLTFFYKYATITMEFRLFF